MTQYPWPAYLRQLRDERGGDKVFARIFPKCIKQIKLGTLSADMLEWLRSEVRHNINPAADFDAVKMTDSQFRRFKTDFGVARKYTRASAAQSTRNQRAKDAQMPRNPCAFNAQIGGSNPQKTAENTALSSGITSNQVVSYADLDACASGGVAETHSYMILAYLLTFRGRRWGAAFSYNWVIANLLVRSAE